MAKRDGVARPKYSFLSIAAVSAAAIMGCSASARADQTARPNLPSLPTADQPAYPTSPYRGVIDGNGQVIPCRCLFKGQQYNLGDLACMSTPQGTVMARCDLVFNNTSWVPTTDRCELSQAARPAGNSSVLKR